MRVLRTTFFLLVLGNLLLFAWGQGYFGPAGGESEAERLSAQIEPDKLRIAGRGGSPPKPSEQPRMECRALAGLDREAAARLVELLSARDAQIRIESRPIEEPASWWVHIPPQTNGALADKKAAELSRLGIRDFYVVRESGPSQFAISLGLFKSEEGARNYLEVLQKKNVKSARILSREVSGDKAVVEVHGTADRLSRALADLPADLNLPAAAECAAARP